MNGRVFFTRLGWMISAVSRIFGLTPFAVRKFFYNALKSFDGNFSSLVRYMLLKSSFKQCGNNVFIGPNVIIKNISSISLGSNISIHANCYLDALGNICIEDNVSIAHNSSLISFEHTWDDSETPIKYNPIKASPIHVKSDVWIGCGVRILSGVTINSRSVIAAGAVVTKDVPSNSLVAGVPAKFIKSLSNENT